MVRYTYITYFGAVSKMQLFEFLTAVLINIAPSTFMAQCVCWHTRAAVSEALTAVIFRAGSKRSYTNMTIYTASCLIRGIQ